MIEINILWNWGICRVAHGIAGGLEWIGFRFDIFSVRVQSSLSLSALGLTEVVSGFIDDTNHVLFHGLILS